MKKITVVALAAIATLALAACTGSDIEATVTKVQALTAKGCDFVPAASAVASILTGGNPIVATAAGAATAICVAVKAKQAPLTLFGRNTDDAAKDCVVIIEGVCVPGEPVRE